MSTEQNHQKISVDDLKRQMRESASVTVIDVLTDSHFASGHIPGAHNACVFEVVFIDTVKVIQPDHRAAIVVVGFSADTLDAKIAAQKLSRAGYQTVQLLDGGVSAWKAAGLPLEKTGAMAPTPPAPEMPPPDGRYVVDIEESRIEWTGRNPNGKHYGKVGLSFGEVELTGGKFTGAFEIDMTSITNTDLAGDPYYQVLIDHLLSDDFFFVDRFPVARFELNEMRSMTADSFAAPNYQVSGAFELLGFQKKLSFPALAIPREDGTVVVSANFDIDRTQWGVFYGSDRFFAHLGKHLVYDMISIELRLVVALQP